jgi:hypothetical protein
MWQPIETAPIGVHVKLGKWRVGFIDDVPDRWFQSDGIARKQGWFGPRIVASDYSHWMPLPAPPEIDT